mmetsp:Transcript_10244/g.28744  ORF Transcript_10244/g.28744 Transcript_10244/m.28744 type:complete len:609 (+) Transcript_10244:289-2115(+)
MFHAMEILVIDTTVVELLLGMRSVDGIGQMCLVHLGVRNKGSNSPLKDRNPILAHTLALHGLRAPKDGLRDDVTFRVGALEQLTQKSLLSATRVGSDSLLVDYLACWIDAHGELGKLSVEEGHTSLEAVGHGHAVRSVQVDVAQHPIDAAKLVLNLTGSLSVGEVEIASEQLISTFSGKDHLHILSSPLRKKPVGDGRTNQLGLVSLHVIDNLRDEIKDLIGSEAPDLVINDLGSTEIFNHALGSHDIGRILHTDGEGGDGAIIPEHSQALLLVQGEKIVGDDAGIDTSTEEETIVDIRHHTLLNSLSESLTNVVVSHIVIRILPGSVIVLHQPVWLVITDHALLGSPVVTGRQSNHGRRVDMSHEGLQFTREDVTIGISIVAGGMRPTIIQGLDANGITGGKGLELTGLLAFLEDDKGKHTIELLDGSGPTELGIGVTDNLAITARNALLIPAMLLLQIGVEGVVVVDLSVGGEVDLLTLECQVEGHISLTVARINNGQTGVAHRPALGTVHAAGGLGTVGTAMVQDAGGIGQGRAGFGQDRRTTGVDVGGRVPHVVDGGNEATKLTLDLRGGGCLTGQRGQLLGNQHDNLNFALSRIGCRPYFERL